MLITCVAMGRISQVLTGRDTRYFELFEASAANGVRAAELLRRHLAEFPDAPELAAEIRALEGETDTITHDIVQRLNQTFVTPIEREDILELASALDDIVDHVDEVTDMIGLYRIEAPMEQSHALAEILVEATRALHAAMPSLRDFGDVSRHTVEVNRLENDGDRVSRSAIADLFDGGIDPMVVIRWKDLYEGLEEAIDACERVANLLEGVVIKNR